MNFLLSIIVATDLHFISPRLTDGGEQFRQVVEEADGKAMFVIDEIVEAFLDEVIAAHPDILILSGDLSFNGAKISHRDLAKKLQRVHNAGVSVCVLPGNHDINYPFAAKYYGSRHKFVSKVSPHEFNNIYNNFGYAQSYSYDKNSGSYIFAPRSDLRIVMLDTNSFEDNEVSLQTLRWLESELKKAKRQNAKVISVSHQTLLSHNAIFRNAFSVVNAEQVVNLYNKYNVICNLAGHMHIQHIAQKDGFNEIVTSSLAVSPHQYGVINFSGDTFTYESRKLNIDAWASKRGKNLPQSLAESFFGKDEYSKPPKNFSEYLKNFFNATTRKQVSEHLADAQVTLVDADKMTEALVAINYDYFSGNKIDLAKHKNTLDLWKTQKQNFFGIYFQSIVADAERDHHALSLKFD